MCLSKYTKHNATVYSHFNDVQLIEGKARLHMHGLEIQSSQVVWIKYKIIHQIRVVATRVYRIYTPEKQSCNFSSLKNISFFQ